MGRQLFSQAVGMVLKERRWFGRAFSWVVKACYITVVRKSSPTVPPRHHTDFTWLRGYSSSIRLRNNANNGLNGFRNSTSSTVYSSSSLSFFLLLGLPSPKFCFEFSHPALPPTSFQRSSLNPLHFYTSPFYTVKDTITVGDCNCAWERLAWITSIGRVRFNLYAKTDLPIVVQPLLLKASFKICSYWTKRFCFFIKMSSHLFASPSVYRELRVGNWVHAVDEDLIISLVSPH